MRGDGPAARCRGSRQFSRLACAAPQREREGGFALLLTIWILIVVALMAASLAAQIRSDTRIAHNQAELAAAKGLADAGIAFGLNGLLDPIIGNRWPADGRARVIRYGGGTIEIHVQDEAGKLDLNMAPIELISGLLHVLALDADSPAMTGGILARRRQYAAGLVQAQAAATQDETPLAASARLPFAMVSELQLVAHLPRSAYDRLRPFVTVYTSSERINPLTAPEPVLLALPGTRPDEVHAYVAARAALAAGQPDQGLPQVSGVDKFSENGELRAATITATATTAAGAVFSREAVFALSLERARNPYTLLHWVQAPDTEEPPLAAKQ
jgi:general secretion pathway protein K